MLRLNYEIKTQDYKCIHNIGFTDFRNLQIVFYFSTMVTYLYVVHTD